MRTGQSRKRDALEPHIVDALEQIGVTVFRISGAGCPDLLCHARGVWLPVEVKSGKAGRLTPAQENARLRAAYPVVRSVADALALFGVRG